MALQVWLPLNGDLHNQGLFEEKVYLSSNLTYNDNGKIGKCMEFNGNPNQILSFSNIPKYENNFSWCCWIKQKNRTCSSYNSTTQYVLSNGRDMGRVGYNIAIYNGVLRAWFGSSSDDSKTEASKAVIMGTLDLNTWYHVCFTVDDSYIYCYLNGSLVKKEALVEVNFHPTETNSYFTIGKMAHGHASTEVYFPFDGMINDVRVYNHCLSPKEVKEISKGLLLHYKLDNAPIENLCREQAYSVGNDANNNLVVTPYVYNGIKGYRLTKTSHGGWGSFIAFPVDHEKLNINKKYSFSVKAVNLGSTPMDVELFLASANSTNSFYNKTSKPITNKLTTIKFEGITPLSTFPTDYNYSLWGWHFNINKTGVDIFIAQPQLEVGEIAHEWNPHQSCTEYDYLGYTNNIVDDCSGFGNDGTVCYNNINYIKNSSYEKGGTSWYGVNNSVITTSNTFGKPTLTCTSYGTSKYVIGQTTSLTHTAGNNQISIFSGRIYSPVQQTIAGGVWIGLLTGWQDAGTVVFESSTLQKGWNDVRATLNITTSDYSGNVVFAFNVSTDCNVHLYHPKLELIASSSVGVLNTPWCPNASDSDYNSFKNNIISTIDSPRYEKSFHLSNDRYINFELPKNMYNMTISMWVKINNKSDYSSLLNARYNPVAGGNIWLSINTEGCYVWVYQSGNSPNYHKYGGRFNYGEWNHIAWTFDNGVSKTYVNGEYKTNQTWTTKTYIPNTYTYCLGNSYTGSSWNGTYFDGDVSDFRVYSATLSDKDIEDLYRVGASVDKNAFYTYEFKEV